MFALNKYHKILAQALACATITACASQKPDNDKLSLLGLYEVSNRTCEGTAIAIEACDSLRFIEFVKGNFYGIADDEIAFVTWSASSGYDLLHSARTSF